MRDRSKRNAKMIKERATLRTQILRFAALASLVLLGFVVFYGGHPANNSVILKIKAQEIAAPTPKKDVVPMIVQDPGDGSIVVHDKGASFTFAPPTNKPPTIPEVPQNLFVNQK